MATLLLPSPISLISFKCHCYLYLWPLFFFIITFNFNYKAYAFEGIRTNIAEESHHTYNLLHQRAHTIQLSSLFPSASCRSSTTNKVVDNKALLKVVHKHGPCSQLNQGQTKTPTQEQILLEDVARVNSIHSKFTQTVKVTDSTTLPAKSGSTIGSGNYIVTVGLGTPKKDLSLTFDTGSDLTWTQCQPCVRSCYKQQDPIFDPADSKSYANISCSSTLCDALESATGNSPGCASSTCVYGIQYGDSSFSVGFFGRERLTLTSTDAFDNFYFGCGQDNQGLFRGAAGLLGLARGKLSLISQTAQKYKKLFSYCLPSSSSSTGFLTFGGSPSKSARFTPLVTLSGGDTFYGLGFTGISVGGRKLSISLSVFSTAGAVIDSGTVITRLPPRAYAALRSAFRRFMSKYPSAPSLSILDTCYDFSNYNTVSVPKIGFFFNGGVVVDIDARGIFYAKSASQVCLAFAGNSDDNDLAIFGNTQQMTLEVVYDVAAGKIGFASGACR